MKKPVQRQSQIITTFGPGAMIDLPTRSVLVGGLDRWKIDSASAKTIDEPVLTRILETWLREHGRLPEGRGLRLRTPPVEPNGRKGEPFGIEVTVFPGWFVLDRVETPIIDGQPRRGRRLLRWSDLDDASGRRKFVAEDDGKKYELSPLRFVGACPNGHIQDIEWRLLLHPGRNCEETLWLVERGTSANLADLEVVCQCGAALSLRDLTQPGRLGICEGRMPWLSNAERETCLDEREGPTKLRLLTRSATNAYFPLTLTVISIPQDANDRLDPLIERHSKVLSRVTSVEKVRGAREFNPDFELDFEDYTDEQIFERLGRRREATEQDAEANPRAREFDRLACGERTIGENTSSSWLFAETLAQKDWARPGGTHLPIVEGVVAVHRLREVVSLYGFTRFEAPPSGADAELDDVRLAVRGARIGNDSDWLPAVEQFGEGIFIKLSEREIGSWLASSKVDERVKTLQDGYEARKRNYRTLADNDFPGAPYYLIHSLSHALMIEIALDCGYPQSSLKERIFAMTPHGGRPARYGILIYTVATGAQGTLGGLVAVTQRLSPVLKNALERFRICSNDPVCADHGPGETVDERALLGAACHGCLLIAETSCERRNNYLDRALILETMAANGASIHTL